MRLLMCQCVELLSKDTVYLHASSGVLRMSLSFSRVRTRRSRKYAHLHQDASSPSNHAPRRAPTGSHLERLETQPSGDFTHVSADKAPVLGGTSCGDWVNFVLGAYGATSLHGLHCRSARREPPHPKPKKKRVTWHSEENHSKLKSPSFLTQSPQEVSSCTNPPTYSA